MVGIQNLTVSFGGEYLFKDITFLINEKDRIGLVGKNGAGKSTLMKIIAKMQEPTSGEISYPRDCTVGYLAQDLKHKGGKTVFEETATAFDEIKKLEKTIEDLTQKITVEDNHLHPDYMDWLQQLHDAQERHDLLGGSSIESELEKVLLGLGFERTDFPRPTSEFSGGWQMRIELAKILLRKPDVILLDEPTNHLDIESIQWLEVFLKNYPGTIILVSHDKKFLDTITTRTIEITNQNIQDYKASYSRYVELRKERRATLLAAQKNQQREIEKTEMLIDKFRAKANKAKMAQSLIKQLDRIEIIEVEDEDNSSIHFRFPDAPRSGVLVAEAKHLTKKYDDKTILNDLNFHINRNDRIAFVGRNGEGKTTLAKIIVGDADANGIIHLGHNVKVGYYAQQQAEKLNGNHTVFETVDYIARGEVRSRLRNLLGAFLFGGDAIDKKVKVLSGGEKSRLALCCLLLEPVNFLVLDEPTNHLDMRSKDILKEALANYNGTLVLVSHDRDFLQGLTNRTFYFRNQTIKEHIGDIYDFLESNKIESLQQLELKNTFKKEAAKEEPGPKHKNNKSKELKKLEKEISVTEKNISQMETAIALLEKKMADPVTMQSAESKDIFIQYDKLKTDLNTEMKSWEALQEQIEKSKPTD